MKLGPPPAPHGVQEKRCVRRLGNVEFSPVPGSGAALDVGDVCRGIIDPDVQAVTADERKGRIGGIANGRGPGGGGTPVVLS